jgi:spore coat polysaccharide biosynthesis predicted glycosyltransferase SpsG
MPTIGIRVDIRSMHTGIKHLVRTVSLAIELSKFYFDVYFFTKSESAHAYIQNQGFNVFKLSGDHKKLPSGLKNLADNLPELDEAMALFQKHGVENLIVDLPDAPPEFYKAYRPLMKRIIQIEDTFRFKTFSNVIVNGSLFFEEFEYPVVPKQWVLSGPSYCLMDHKFLDMPLKKIKKFVKDIFLSIREHDKHHVSVPILKTLLSDESVKSTRIHCVTNSKFPDLETLNQLAHEHSHLILHHDPKNLLDILSDCDIGITNDVFTIYRLIASGVPTISMILPQDYENMEDFNTQRFNEEDGMIESIWAHKYIGLVAEEEFFETLLLKKVLKLMDSYNMRSTLHEKGKKAIDGKGSFRVATELKRLIKN